MRSIHNDTFGKAAKKIAKFQEKYAKAYDKRHLKNNKKYVKLRKGMNVQYLKHKSKKPKGNGGIKWFPRARPYKIHSINHENRVVYLQDPKSGHVLKTKHPFERIRPFRGK